MPTLHITLYIHESTRQLWDTRKRDPIHTVEMPTPVTTLVFDRTGEHIFFGGVDNMVHAYDVRAGEIAWSLQGHADTVTGLSLSGDGERLLSNSMDNTVGLR